MSSAPIDRKRHRSDELERVLADEPFKHDRGRAAKLALAFCDCVAAQLDREQAAAVEVARRYWDGGDREEHVAAVREFAARINADTGAQRHGPAAARNQLVWAALNVGTGLSAYIGDFLVGVAEEAGIPDDALDASLADQVPGFVKP